jgi:hypothetical protein
MDNTTNDILRIKIMKNILLYLYFGLLLIVPQQVASQAPGSTPTDFGSTGETGTNPDDNAVPIADWVGIMFIIGASLVLIKQHKQLKT